MADFVTGTDGTGITPPAGATGIRGWLSGCYSTLVNLLSSVNSQAIATSTPGNPANQVLSVQGANENILIGPVSLTAAGTFFEQNLSTSGSPFSEFSINCTAFASGASIQVFGCNEPPAASTRQWNQLQLQAAINANVSSSLGGIGGVYGPCAFAFIQVRVVGAFTGTVTVTAFFTKNMAQLRSVTSKGDPVGFGVTGSPVGIGLQALSAAPTPTSNNFAEYAIGTLEGVQITKPFSLPQADWSYGATAGGINASTTPVVLVAATAGKRPYLTSMEIDWSTLPVATEVVLLDGSSTVLWRGFLGTGSGNRSIYFPSPLKPAIGDALEFQVVTSTAGAVYVNAQGYWSAI